MQQDAGEGRVLGCLVRGLPDSRTVVTCKISLLTQEGGVEKKMASSQRTRLAPPCFCSSSQGQADTFVPSSLSHLCQHFSWMWHPTPILVQGEGISASLFSNRLREAQMPLCMGLGHESSGFTEQLFLSTDQVPGPRG